VDAITLTGPGSTGNQSPAATTHVAAEPADPNRFEAALDKARSPRDPAQRGHTTNGHAGRPLARGCTPSTAQAPNRTRAAGAAGIQPSESGHQPAPAGMAGDVTNGGRAADAEAGHETNRHQGAEGAAPVVETAAAAPVVAVPPADHVELSLRVSNDESGERSETTVGAGGVTVAVQTDPPLQTAATAAMPRSGAAPDTGRGAFAPAIGVRAHVAAISGATVQAAAPAAAEEPALAQGPAAAANIETADVADEPAPLQAAREAPVSAGTGLPGGRAYLRAVKALETTPWVAALAAGTAAGIDRTPAEAGGTPAPVPAPTTTEAHPQALAASLSAHAAAFLRSLGIATAPEMSGSAAAAHAEPQPSPADVMAAVAIEFAAADAGDKHRGGDGSGAGSDRWNGGGGVDTANSPSHAAESFTVATSPIPVSRPDGTLVAPATAPGSPAAEPPMTGQIVKAVALAWRDGIGEARIRLAPEHLGEVTVSMRVDRGQVTAEMVAATATARAWIETHQQDLRDGLSQQGLHLDRLVVTSDGQRQRQQPGDGADRQRRQSPRRRDGQEPPRFELIA
jgi:flagellar hook-length control protein FliK